MSTYINIYIQPDMSENLYTTKDHSKSPSLVGQDYSSYAVCCIKKNTTTYINQIYHFMSVLILY